MSRLSPPDRSGMMLSQSFPVRLGGSVPPEPPRTIPSTPVMEPPLLEISGTSYRSPSPPPGGKPVARSFQAYASSVPAAMYLDQVAMNRMSSQRRRADSVTEPSTIFASLRRPSISIPGPDGDEDALQFEFDDLSLNPAEKAREMPDMHHVA